MTSCSIKTPELYALMAQDGDLGLSHRLAGASLPLVDGDFDVILLVRAVDNIDLRRVLLDQLQSIPGGVGYADFPGLEDVDTR